MTNGAELDLSTWTAISVGQEHGLEELATKLAMTPYLCLRTQRIDRPFFHRVETVFRPSRVSSALFAVSHMKHEAKRVIEVRRKVTLRGYPEAATTKRGKEETHVMRNTSWDGSSPVYTDVC